MSTAGCHVISIQKEEEEPDSGMLQTRRNRSVSSGLPFTYPTAGAATPNTACSTKPSELLQLFIIIFLLMILVQELFKQSSTCHHQYYCTVKSHAASKSPINPIINETLSIVTKPHDNIIDKVQVYSHHLPYPAVGSAVCQIPLAGGDRAGTIPELWPAINIT
jgi:hypothetical protein